eukprot:1785458-Rhodomonas_salina.1
MVLSSYLPYRYAVAQYRTSRSTFVAPYAHTLGQYWISHRTLRSRSTIHYVRNENREVPYTMSVLGIA